MCYMRIIKATTAIKYTKSQDVWIKGEIIYTDPKNDELHHCNKEIESRKVPANKPLVTLEPCRDICKDKPITLHDKQNCFADSDKVLTLQIVTVYYRHKCK